METIFTPAVIEAIKEALRLIVLGIVSFIITTLAGQDGEMFLVLATVLRGVDKWIHVNPSRFNGLLPF